LKKILIVDDDKISREIFQEYLKDFSESLIMFEDGKCAYEKLSSENKISLVITDIIMPEMDGWELIKKIRGLPKHKKTPIIVVTSAEELDDISKLFELGGLWFFNKPIEKTKLIELVGSIS